MESKQYNLLITGLQKHLILFCLTLTPGLFMDFQPAVKKIGLIEYQLEISKVKRQQVHITSGVRACCLTENFQYVFIFFNVE